MDEAELRTRIRELLRSGELPRTLPPAQVVRPGGPARAPQIQVGRSPGATCTACGETDPDVTYLYPAADLVVRFHTTCNAIWNDERQLA
jgi:hypothetical protein